MRSIIRSAWLFHLKPGLGASRANSDSDLRQAGRHFANAVVLAGITVIAALFFRAKPKVFDEMMFKGTVPRPMGPGPRNGRFSYKPETTVAPISQQRIFTAGVTDEYGDIVIEQRMSGADQKTTLYHEQVHQFLTPKLYFLRNVRIQVAMEGYNRSYLLRYLEEALAESAATLRNKGASGLPEGLSFPVKNGYVTIAKMGKEARGIVLGTVNVGAGVYRVCYSSGRPK